MIEKGRQGRHLGWLLASWATPPLVVTLFLVISLTATSSPAARGSVAYRLPADICPLLPTVLVSRLVPAGKIDRLSTTNGGRHPNSVDCRIVNEVDAATGEPAGALAVEVRAFDAGDSGDATAVSSLRYRSLVKGWEQDKEVEVTHLDRLGDDAVLALWRPDATDREYQRLSTTVVVRRGDLVFRVDYQASPTDRRHASAASVAVARAILAKVR